MLLLELLVSYIIHLLIIYLFILKMGVEPHVSLMWFSLINQTVKRLCIKSDSYMNYCSLRYDFSMYSYIARSHSLLTIVPKYSFNFPETIHASIDKNCFAWLKCSTSHIKTDLWCNLILMNRSILCITQKI